MNIETSVLERYSQGAKEAQPALCCAVDYNQDLLRLLPQEIIDKDYGCGDPSQYVREGDVVLDLGSGSGKICYMAAQLVGEKGQVIGVDMNDDMLALARKYRPTMAEKLGNDRVRFVKAYIQDLALDLEATDSYLADHRIQNSADLMALTVWQQEQRRDDPLIPDASVDLVVSNCVLNLVQDAEKQQLIREIYRILKPGGRVAISDIVSDEPVPPHLKTDLELWSGCISGAMQEHQFIQAFVDTGFIAVDIDKWDAAPWQVVENIEFRSVTVTAIKGEGSECLDVGHAVIYQGPYSQVTDDEGHIYSRGERMAVCERTFRLLTENGPYAKNFIGITPTAPTEPKPWCAPTGTRRPVAETKNAVVKGNKVLTSGCC